MELYFPFAEYWSFYLIFTLGVLVLLAIDLGVFHKDSHVVRPREALVWTGVWVTCAILFGVGLYFTSLSRFRLDPSMAAEGLVAEAEAWRLTMEFFTGYLIEKALAIDNVFVFAVIFSSFGIVARFQHKILFYGVLGALVFRMIFIALGSVLMSYHAIVILFGVFLIYAGAKLIFAEEKKVDLEKSPVMKFLKRFIPLTSNTGDGSFFLREQGKLVATPLLLTLAFVEISDIIFAFDSVPAIFAVTSEPFLVFTSNVFAVLGLRSMFFLLSDMMDRAVYLKYALAVILVFVGMKMSFLNSLFGGKFPISWSLLFILSTIILATFASWVSQRQGEVRVGK